MIKIFIMLLMLTGCQQKAPELPFNDYLDTIMIEMIDETDIAINLLFNDPSTFGIEPTEYEFGFATESDYEEAHTFYQDTIKTLKSYKDFDQQQALDRDVLVSYFESQLENVKFYDYEAGSVLGYNRQMVANVPTYLEVYEFRTEADVDRYFNFIETLPAYYEQILELELNRQKNNTGLGQEVIDETIKMAENLVEAASKDDYFLVRLFNEKMDEATFNGESYKSEHQTLIKTQFVDSYKLLADGLSQIKAKETAGLYYLKDGRKYYNYLLKKNTGLNMNVKEIKTFLGNQLDLSISKIVNFNEEEINQLYDDNFYPHYLSGLDLLSALFNDMKADFPEIEPVNYRLQTVDPSMAESASPAYYFTPALDYDGTSPQHIFINGQHDSKLYTTYAHEGFPGHMYQFNFNLNSDMHPIRNLISSSANSEGWANYTENYAIKYITNERFMELYTINQEITQIITVLIDIGIHDEGWLLEDMVDYLKQINMVNPSASTEDFKDMYIYIASNPAVYPMYYVSSLRIKMLKEKAMEKWEDYSDMKFHQAFLEIGSARFDVIEAYLDLD